MIRRASSHLKKRSFQSPLTRVSVPTKATYTAGNRRGWSDYELTALSRGKHFAKKPNLNFCLTTRASRGRSARPGIARIKVPRWSFRVARRCIYIYIHIRRGHSGVGRRRSTEQKWRDERSSLGLKEYRVTGRVRSVSRSGDYTFAPIIYQPIMASDLSGPSQWESPFKSSRRIDGAPISFSRSRSLSPSFFYFILLKNFRRAFIGVGRSRSSRIAALKYDSPYAEFMFLITSEILIVHVENYILRSGASVGTSSVLSAE